MLPKKPTLLLLVAALLVPLSLHAQSGRNRGTKIEPGKTAPTESGVIESKINPEGETVEGDVIRTDTALVTVPVTVLDRYGRYVPLLRRENFRVLENGVEYGNIVWATTRAPLVKMARDDRSR